MHLTMLIANRFYAKLLYHQSLSNVICKLSVVHGLFKASWKFVPYNTYGGRDWFWLVKLELCTVKLCSTLVYFHHFILNIVKFFFQVIPGHNILLCLRGCFSLKFGFGKWLNHWLIIVRWCNNTKILLVIVLGGGLVIF